MLIFCFLSIVTAYLTQDVKFFHLNFFFEFHNIELWSLLSNLGTGCSQVNLLLTSTIKDMKI